MMIYKLSYQFRGRLLYNDIRNVELTRSGPTASRSGSANCYVLLQVYLDQPHKSLSFGIVVNRQHIISRA
jgi:hypothetical protein